MVALGINRFRRFLNQHERKNLGMNGWVSWIFVKGITIGHLLYPVKLSFKNPGYLIPNIFLVKINTIFYEKLP